MKFVSIQCHLQLHKSQKHCPPSLNSPVHWIYKQLVGIFIYIIATYCLTTVQASVQVSQKHGACSFTLVLLQVSRSYKVCTPRYYTEVDKHFLKSPVELISNFSTAGHTQDKSAKLCQNVSSRSRFRNGNETCWIRNTVKCMIRVQSSLQHKIQRYKNSYIKRKVWVIKG